MARPSSLSQTSKHDLPARPIFHHTQDTIEAHPTVVMASPAVARHLQDTTGISIARIVRELRGLQDLNSHRINAADPLIPEAAAEILKSLKTLRRQKSGLSTDWGDADASHPSALSCAAAPTASAAPGLPQAQNTQDVQIGDKGR